MKKKKYLPASIDRSIKNTIKTIAIGSLMNISGQLTKPMIDKFCMLLRDKALYSVGIQYEMHRIEYGLIKYFKQLPKRVDIVTTEDGDDDIIIKPAAHTHNSNFFELIVYRGVPIGLVINEREDRSARPSANTSRLYTLNNQHCINVLKQFIRTLMNINTSHRMTEIKDTFIVESENNTAQVIVQDRTFDNVFIPNVDKERLMKALDSYIINREFYEYNKLPNHFGILLYGASGTGKSSLAIAIQNYLNAQMFCMNGDQLSMVPGVLRRLIWSSSGYKYAYRILLIEDIDSWVFSKDRQKKDDKDDDSKKDIGLASILNAIDGIGAPTNIIYIFTTNHLEMLDPALVRPGRMDISIEMGYVNEEVLKQFLAFHYPDETIPTIEYVRDGITCGELQTLVMQGASVDDIISHCSNTSK